MKLTTERLKKLIREELEKKVLNELTGVDKKIGQNEDSFNGITIFVYVVDDFAITDLARKMPEIEMTRQGIAAEKSGFYGVKKDSLLYDQLSSSYGTNYDPADYGKSYLYAVGVPKDSFVDVFRNPDNSINLLRKSQLDNILKK